jgi:hypothetical protein
MTIVSMVAGIFLSACTSMPEQNSYLANRSIYQTGLESYLENIIPILMMIEKNLDGGNSELQLEKMAELLSMIQVMNESAKSVIPISSRRIDRLERISNKVGLLNNQLDQRSHSVEISSEADGMTRLRNVIAVELPVHLPNQLNFKDKSEYGKVLRLKTEELGQVFYEKLIATPGFKVLTEKLVQLRFEYGGSGHWGFFDNTLNTKEQMVAPERVKLLDIYHVLENSVDAIADRSLEEGPDYTGLISIAFWRSKESLNIQVRDNGIGFPKATLDKVFIEFPFPTDKGSDRAGGRGEGLHNLYGTNILHRLKGWIEIGTYHQASGGWILAYDPKLDPVERTIVPDELKSPGTIVYWNFQEAYEREGSTAKVQQDTSSGAGHASGNGAIAPLFYFSLSESPHLSLKFIINRAVKLKRPIHLLLDTGAYDWLEEAGALKNFSDFVARHRLVEGFDPQLLLRLVVLATDKADVSRIAQNQLVQNVIQVPSPVSQGTFGPIVLNDTLQKYGLSLEEFDEIMILEDSDISFDVTAFHASKMLLTIIDIHREKPLSAFQIPTISQRLGNLQYLKDDV